MTIEVSSPTLGTHVLLIDELIEIMEKATEAVERFETPSRKVLDQTEKPMSKQTKNAVPTTKPEPTFACARRRTRPYRSGFLRGMPIHGRRPSHPPSCRRVQTIQVLC